MKGYYGRPDATAEAIKDGWFRSGDEGFYKLDDQGRKFLFISGRIKELIIRGDISKCLIVAPGILVEQWQDEMDEKFNLQFEIMTNEGLEAARTGNWFQEHNLCLCRLDKLSRNEDIQEKLKVVDWDLVVVDESVTFALTEVRIGVAAAIISVPILRRVPPGKIAAAKHIPRGFLELWVEKAAPRERELVGDLQILRGPRHRSLHAHHDGRVRQRRVGSVDDGQSELGASIVLRERRGLEREKRGQQGRGSNHVHSHAPLDGLPGRSVVKPPQTLCKRCKGSAKCFPSKEETFRNPLPRAAA